MASMFVAECLHNKIEGLKVGGMEIVRIEVSPSDAEDLRADSRFTPHISNLSVGLFKGVRVEIIHGDYFEPSIVWRHGDRMMWCSIYTGKSDDLDDEPYPYDTSEAEDPGAECAAPSEFRLNIPGVINICVDLPGL